jgi:hypothetical protein
MRSLYLLLIVLVFTFSFGQEENTTGTKTEQNETIQKNESLYAKQRRKEVSFEFLGIVDGRSIFGYERSFGNHWSAKIGGGPKTEEGLFNISGIERERLKTGDINYSGFSFYLEGRYYLEKFQHGRAIGFYFGLYAKNTSFQSDINGNYLNSTGESFNFLFDTDISVFSAGFMFGYKLPVGKRFAFDFLIAGPGTANYGFNIKNKSDPLPDEFF